MVVINKSNFLPFCCSSIFFFLIPISPFEIILLLSLVVVALWFIRQWALVQKKTELLISREKNLQESEKKYRNLIENALDAIFIMKDYLFIECNLKTLDMFCCKKQDIIGRSPMDFSPEIQPDGLSSLEKGYEKMNLAMGGFPQFFEWKHMRMDGTVFDAEVSLNSIELGNDTYLQAIVRNITERKLADYALQRSEEKYRSIFENSVEGMFQTTPEGRFISANPSLARLFGYSSPQELMKDLTDIGKQHYVNPEDRETFRRTIEADGIIRNFETRLLKKDGSFIWASLTARAVRDKTGTVQYYEGFLEDISFRKEIEDALRQSQQRLLSIIEFLPDATFAIDNDGRIIAWNRAIEEMTGYTAEMMLGKTDHEYAIPFYGERRFILVDFLSLWDDDIAKKYYFIKKDGDILYTEADVPCVRGQKRILWAKAAHLRDAEGNIAGAIESIRDITDQKHAEAEREKLQTQLLQSQKMESVGRLAGGVAHDFNNMLGVILGYTELALNDMDPSEPYYSKFTEIHKAAERSADLTRQLLAFARKQTVAPRVLDLNETIKGMLEMLSRLIGEDIDLAWQPGRNPGLVKIDPSQIDQILVNLCINARDAITGVGKITIETSSAVFDEAHCAKHAGSIPGEYLLLNVSDNGSGMDKETMNRLFEPFFTTKAKGKGTGLGLATVYGIVKQNKGYINANSEQGKGTVFSIYLPKYYAEVDQILEADNETQVSFGYETIMLVEDEPSILSMTMAMLKSLKYRVIPVSTPGEALRIVREYTGEIHLLITDVIMPEMNGPDLAGNILELYPDIKVLYMSGYTADVIAHHCILDPRVHFIEKPFTILVLADKVKEALGMKRRHEN